MIDAPDERTYNASMLHIKDKYFSTTRTRVVGIFFFMLILIGLVSFNDYGISADEPQVSEFGGQVFLYLFFGGPPPTAFDWTFHNPIFRIFYSSTNLLFALWGYTDARFIWFTKHLLSYGTYLFAFVALYRIALRLFRNNWKLALLSCCLLLLSPRVFAHAFYNPKDIPALITFTISMATLFKARASGYSWQWLLPHALACAVSTSIRTSGLLVPLFTLFAIGIDLVQTPKFALRKSVLFGLMYAVLLWAVWPRLWEAPIEHFIEAFSSNASREGGGLYLGEYVNSTPWHYVFVWMTITTPLAYSLFFLAGLADLCIRMVKAPFVFIKEESNWLFIALWYIGPLAALIIMDVGIFGEWRHVLFIYPAFVLIAVRGLAFLASHHTAIVRKMSFGVLGASMLLTSLWMMENHPGEYAYFSIPNTLVEDNFELDYWSLSYYEAIKWVLENDDRPTIPLYTSARIGHVSGNLMPPDQRKRLHFVAPNNASYILDNFQRNAYKKTLPENRALHSISVDGLNVLTIYKGPDLRGRYPQHENYP